MDERDAEDAIRGVDNRPFGYDRRRLSVEWARVQCSYRSPVFFIYTSMFFKLAVFFNHFKISIPVLLILISLFFQGERGRPRDGSRSVANQRPTKTLFIINFDPIRTTVRDIERHFEPYGRILHVRIRRNFAFVQFETQEDATKALECTHMRFVTWFFHCIAFLTYFCYQINGCCVILQQAFRQSSIC